jgi:hypothetical protein
LLPPGIASSLLFWFVSIGACPTIMPNNSLHVSNNMPYISSSVLPLLSQCIPSIVITYIPNIYRLLFFIKDDAIAAINVSIWEL